jgi:hypothetical protein
VVALVETLLMQDESHDNRHMLIDIKPGSYPSAINLCSMGKVPVDLFGNPELDVSMMDIATVMFGPMHHLDAGAPMMKYTFEDVTAMELWMSASNSIIRRPG